MTVFLIILRNLISTALYLLLLDILINAVFSWIPQMKMTAVGRIIENIAEPFVRPFRNLLRRVGFLRNIPIDFSPLLAMVAIEIVDTLVRILFIYLFALL